MAVVSSAHTLTEGPAAGVGLGRHQAHADANTGSYELGSIGRAVAAVPVAAPAISLIGLPAPLLTGTATALAALADAPLPALFRRSPRIRWSR
ncbi:hypothetical protein [Streptomyces sp. NPDC051214]|uniref:hypothetical protein n=1 Tax=Streptomyces sp. NPDC051214 TaxID=3155282 RepID=UPI0034344DA6